MKYCLDYYKICRYTNKCDQLNFTYNKRDEALLSFLQEHANQRINLVIKDEDIGYINKDLEQIVGLQTEKPLKRAIMPAGRNKNCRKIL